MAVSYPKHTPEHDTTMTKKEPADWLELSLKRPLFGYRDHFGKMPDPSVIKFAPTGLDAVNELLNEHVMRDEEVVDWGAFVGELLRRKAWSKGK